MLGNNTSSKGNLFWDASEGSLNVRTGTSKKFRVETDGDMFLGSSAGAASSNYLAVFGAGQTFGLETVGAGDILLGQNDATTKGNVFWDASDSSLNIRTGTAKKFRVESDGDVLVGTDAGAVATTVLALFNNNQTYNGESVQSGDLLLGDNSVNKASMLWDKSAGKLSFRGGNPRTEQVYIDTSGKLSAAGGKTWIDSQGLKLSGGDAAYDPGASIKMMDGSSAVLDFYQTKGSGNQHYANLWMNKDHAIAGPKYLHLKATTANTSTDASIGFSVEQYQFPVLSSDWLTIGIMNGVSSLSWSGENAYFQGLAATNAQIGQVAVTGCTFINSWVNYGSPEQTCGYYRDSLYRVQLRGLVKSGTAGQAILTLPPGHRPSASEIFSASAWVGGVPVYCRVQVDALGNVIPHSTCGNAYVSLAGISFRAAGF